MIVELSEREMDLITTGLYMLESACIGKDLHYELENDLGGTPDDEEVRKIMDKIKDIYRL